MDIAELGFRVNTQGLERATRELRNLREEGDRTERSGGLINRSMRNASGGITEAGRASLGLSAGLRTLGGVIAGIGFLNMARDAINMADAYRSMNATLSVVTNGTQEFEFAQSRLQSIARSSRVDIQALTSLYANIAPSLQQMGRSQEEIARTTELVSRAMQIGGGSAQEHSNAIRQLSQAMGSGVLRGDEFNSIMENGRGLAIQLAAGLDVPIGSLRAMAEAGELTADIVVDALLRQGQTIDQVFSTLPVTAGAAWTLVRNAAIQTIGEIDAELGASEQWAKSLVAAADGISQFSSIAIRGIADLSIEWSAFKADLNFSDEAPWRALRDIGDAVNEVSSALKPALPYLKEFAIALVSLTAAAAAVKLVTGALALLGAAVALINPVSLAVLALGAAAVVIQNNWQGFSSWWQTTWRDAEGAADRFVKWWNGTTFEEKELDIKTEILETAQEAADTFIKLWNDYELKEYVPEIALDVLETAASKFGEFFDVVSKGLADSESEIRSSAIGSAFEEIWGDIVVAAERVWDDISAGIKEAFPDIVSGISEAFSDVDRIFGEVIKTGEAFVKDFGNLWEGLYPALKQIIESGWDIIVRVFDVAWIAIKASVETGWDLVTGVVEAGLQVLRGDFEAGWMTLADTAYEFGANLVTAILSVFPAMQDAGRDILVAVGKGILASAYVVAEAFNSALLNAFSISGQLVGTLFQAGQDTVSGFVDGIFSWVGEVANAAGEMAGVVEPTVREKLKTQSPSLVMKDVGRDVVLGFANGITENLGEIRDSVAAMGDEAIRNFERIAEGINRQLILLKEGPEAMRRWELAQLGINGAAQDYVITQEANIRALEAAKKLEEERSRILADVARGLADIAYEQALWTAELEGGSGAAARLELELQGYTREQANNVAATRENIAAQREFRDALANSIVNADSIKGALSNMGDYIKGWLKEKIAFFAANKITAVLGVDGSGVGSGLNGILNGVMGTLGSAIGSMGGMFSTAISSVFGAATTASTGLFNGMTMTTNAITGLSGGLMAAIAPIGAVAAGAAILSKVLGGDDGRNNLRDVMIRVVDGVVEVRQRMGDEGDQLVTQIQQVFDGLVTGVRTQAELLGVEGADAIMEGYSNATGRLSIDDIAADSEAWLGRLGRVAYQQLYDTLGPELQAAIDASVDLANSSIDDIEAAFGRLTFIATDIVPLFDAAGIQISNSTQQTIAGVEGIVAALESMGIPINESIGLIQQLIPGFDAATFAMQQNEQAIMNWNESIGQISTSATTTADDMRLLWGALDQAGMSSGIAADMIQQFVTEANGVATLDVVALQNYIASLDQTTVAGQAASEAAGVLANAFGVDLSQSMITSMAGLTQYIASLDATSEGYDQAVASAIALIPAIQAVEAAEAARIETMNGVAESFRGIGVVFDTMIPSALGASEALITAAGGMDQFTSDMSFYLNNFYSEAERGEIVLANAAGEVSAFNDMLGLTGAEAIDTREELRAYLDELVASGAIYTETGAEAYAAGLAVAEAIDAMTNSGLSLEEAISSLPPELQAVAQGMGLVGDESAGVGDQMSQAAQMFYDAAQLIAIAAGVSKTELGGLETALANMGGAVGTAVTDVLAHVTLFGTKFPDINRTLDDVAARTKVAQEAMAASTRTLDSDTAASAAKVLQSVAAMTQALDQVAASMVTSAGAVDGAAAQVTQSFMALAQNIQAATALVVAATNTAGMSMAEMARSMTASAGQVTQAGFTGSSAITSLAQIISASASSVKGSSLSLTGSMQAMSGSLITAAGQVNSASATAGGAMNTLAGIFASGAKGISSASSVAGNAMRTLASNVQSGAGSINSAAGSVGGGLNSVSSKIRGFLSSISSAAGSAAKSAQAAQNAAKNASSGGLGGIAGSFATGLDYVPRDGFVAELHKGEMVVPADIAEGLRAAGVYAQQPSANAPSVAVSRPNNTSDGVVTELRALRKEVEALRQDNAESSSRSNNILGNIAGTNSRQVQGIETVRRELDQQSKKLALR